MGRPLAKRFFGNTNAGGLAGKTVASVTVSGTNNGYVTFPSVSFSTPALPGGVQAQGTAVMGVAAAVNNAAGTGYTTGDVLTVVGGTYTVPATITVTAAAGLITGVSAVTPGSYSVLPAITGAAVTGGTGNNATFDLTFKVVSVTVTNPGSGYDVAATASPSTGNATLTPVMSTSAVPSIVAYAFTGAASKKADIVKQTGSHRFKVNTADTAGTPVVAYLKASAATTAGEMTITGFDEANGTYFVTKLTAHKAVVTRGTGTVHANGAIVGWTFGAANNAAGIIKIENA